MENDNENSMPADDSQANTSNGGNEVFSSSQSQSQSQNEPSVSSNTPKPEAVDTPAKDIPVETAPPQAAVQQIDQVPPPQASQILASSQPSQNSFIKNLLARALEKVQFNKRKKLDKIMELATKQRKITNANVCKALRISKATAVRYLDILEKQGKIKQMGKTGRDSFLPTYKLNTSIPPFEVFTRKISG